MDGTHHNTVNSHTMIELLEEHAICIAGIMTN